MVFDPNALAFMLCRAAGIQWRRIGSFHWERKGPHVGHELLMSLGRQQGSGHKAQIDCQEATKLTLSNDLWTVQGHHNSLIQYTSK